MKKTVFIGSVLSSKIALETLVELGINIDLVCSLDEKYSKNVSDYYPIHDIAEKKGIPFLKFKKINSDKVVESIKKVNPDFIFVIGLSQIISKHILDLPNKYAIGFHPTPLPKFRGRAALPWQILLGVRESKVSLFKLDENMDSGDIICQYPYSIDENDYAMDVYIKVCNAMKLAFKECLLDIYNDSVNFIKQKEEDATYLLIRRPEDGKIDWNWSGNKIHTLIRAASKPYPGAFAYYKGEKVIFWKAKLEKNDKYIGIPGQIAWIGNKGEIGIVAKDSLIVVTDYLKEDSDILFSVGHKFE
ncbi:MAG: methionyl-tRNA formyltransferase [Clostridiales bacterium]|nr:methionyl-tRNA formyltransferase [Clostridiales bacterium]